MPVQLMKLRGVPEDELEELYALLDEHEINYYETSAGNWGTSLPALWLSDPGQFPRARALLDEYQQQRYRQARAAYEASRRAGTARTFGDILRENPLRAIGYLVIVGGLIYISIAPFTGFGQE